MYRPKLSPIVVFFFVSFSQIVFGQSWSGILSPSRAVDWSQAGSAHINDVRTQCVTSQCAAVSAGTVTAASINAALASAPANTYVLVPAGTFTVSGTLTFHYKSNLTLRGAGSNSTFLIFTGSSSSDNGCSGYMICASSSDMNYADTSETGGASNAATWTGTNGVAGTYTKGATSITIGAMTKGAISTLQVGDPIVLDQVDDSNDTGGMWVGCEISNSLCGNDGPAGYQRGRGSASTIRGQQQIVNVTSISGSGPWTIGITPGIYMNNWRTSQNPGAWWASSPAFNDGVENLSISTTTTAKGINFFNTTGCWAKAIRLVNTNTSGVTSWGWVDFAVSNHGTVRDSYFYSTVDDSYGVNAFVASDLLIENNINHHPGTNSFFSSDCEGCVTAYNYAVAPVYGTSPGGWMSTADGYHSVSLLGLHEGNIGASLYADGYHGAQDLNTFFRNRFTGREQNNGGLTTGNTAAVQLSPGGRYFNIIANVLGTVGYHSSYKAIPGADTNWNAVISAGLFEGTGGQSSLPYPTSMWWGNWDNVTNAVRWCGNSSDTGWSTTCAGKSEVPSAGLPNGNAYSNPVPASETLPDSFYLSGKPSWWPAGKAWPNIGPGVTGGTVGQCAGGAMQSSSCSANSQCPGSSCSVVAGGRVVSSPAMDCYFNEMGGSANGTESQPLAFDAAACYPTLNAGSGGGGSVTPPSGLSATVQ
jgi:hypothetical protein